MQIVSYLEKIVCGLASPTFFFLLLVVLSISSLSAFVFLPPHSSMYTLMGHVNQTCHLEYGM
eukprot:m.70800 g.70800  ORF g.70800 m.70800 type:complete len:62 (+) comp13790_c0_seq1:128-313(+)